MLGDAQRQLLVSAAAFPEGWGGQSLGEGKVGISGGHTSKAITAQRGSRSRRLHLGDGTSGNPSSRLCPTFAPQSESGRRNSP